MQRLTKEQAMVMTAYTGVLCGPFSDFHAYAEALLKRPFWLHQFADREITEALKNASRADFIAMCDNTEPTE